MASLKKRNGNFYAQFYDPKTKKQRRKSLGTSHLGMAKKRLVGVEADIAAGRSEFGPTRTPLPDILTAYIRDAEVHKKGTTVSAELAYLRDLFGPLVPELLPGKAGEADKYERRDKAPLLIAKYLEDITTAQIADCLNARVKMRGIAPKTHNHYLSIVRRLFNWAIQERGIRLNDNLNPATKVKRMAEPSHEIAFLTRTQITKQLEALEDKPQLRSMVAMYIFAGLRREELLWLRNTDIDLSKGHNGVIHIRSKTVGDESWTPKTKVNRIVPISKELAQILSTYKPPKNAGFWYFPSPDGLRWDPNNFSADLRQANLAHGLEWTCLHYRHTFGSHLAMKNESLFKISKLMGNSPEICRKHYAALLPESLYDSVDFDDNVPTTANRRAELENVVPFRRGA